MPKPKQKRIIVLQSSKHDSGSGSWRDAIARSQDESTESEGWDSLTGEGYSNGNDSSDSGMPNDILMGGYSENGELFCSGASSVETTLLPAIQHIREAVSEFSGVSSVEATLLPAIQRIREHAYFSGTSSVETIFTSMSGSNTSPVIL
jgi:hypothetical protein